MSGFEFRPKLKDTDYYLDALTDVIDNNLGEAKTHILLHLRDEEEAATLNNELAVAALLGNIRRYLISQ